MPILLFLVSGITATAGLVRVGGRTLSQKTVQLLVVLPILLAVAFGAAEFWIDTPSQARHTSLWESPATKWALAAFFAVLLWLSAASLWDTGLRRGWLWYYGAVPLICTTLGYSLLLAIQSFFIDWKQLPAAKGEWKAAIFGPPVLLLVLSLMAVLMIGLLGRRMPDARREWWSRLAAWIGIYGSGYLAASILAVYAPLWLAQLLESGQNWAKTGLSLSWIATTVGGIFAAKSSSTGVKNGGSAKLELLAAVGPYVFITGLLALLASGLHLVLNGPLRPAGLSTVSPLPAELLVENHWRVLDPSRFQASVYFYALGLLLVALLVLAARVDINEFSLNHFYRNRLARCYLGASRTPRDPDHFTGLDFSDDLPLADLVASKGYLGPYPIVNTALNLEDPGDATLALSLQERKCASFTFSPLHSGSGLTGYRPTDRYIHQAWGNRTGGMKLGTVVSISGAAASPNQGYHTAPAIAFLMTMFNVRLGWWVPNPGKKRWHTTSPRFSLRYLLAELFGSAGDKSAFMYLSDGGHFENLALYELVRRGCDLIVLGDGEEDHDLAFGSLGRVIRMCRVDALADIQVDVSPIRKDAAGRSQRHFVEGTIHYLSNSKTAGKTGKLVYIKSSMTGDEPTDVLQYESENPAFPHQSTGDQFFDEPQFESYRQLGRHIAAGVIAAGVIS